jgi:hypothetical protein
MVNTHVEATILERELPLEDPSLAATRPAQPAPAPITRHEACAASLVAGIGLELEIGGTRVRPFVPKGTILIEGRGWNLETDKRPNQELADMEFVVAPMYDWPALERALEEIAALVHQLRERALADKACTVALRDLASDDAPYRVLHPFLDTTVQVFDLHLTTRLQATYGVRLDQMHLQLDHVLGEQRAAPVHAATERVAEHCQRLSRAPLLPRSRGFVELLNYYLSCTRVPRNDKFASVHIYFRMLARSDFCSMFDKLLDGAERSQMESLLLAPAPGVAPAFLAALGLAGDAPLFLAPYYGIKYQDETGPTIQAWLESIVKGRGAGPLRKDLMSPPPGYPLHAADVDRNYGAGAMGVDQDNGFVLFEIRDTVHRQDLALNEAMVRAAMFEYVQAAQRNPALAAIDDAFIPVAPRLARIKAREAVRHAVNELRHALGRVLGKEGESNWKRIREARLQAVDASMNRLRAQVAAAERPSPAEASLNALGTLAQFTRGCIEPGQAAVFLPVLSMLQARCEYALWTEHSGVALQ